MPSSELFKEKFLKGDRWQFKQLQEVFRKKNEKEKEQMDEMQDHIVAKAMSEARMYLDTIANAATWLDDCEDTIDVLMPPHIIAKKDDMGRAYDKTLTKAAHSFQKLMRDNGMLAVDVIACPDRDLLTVENFLESMLVIASDALPVYELPVRERPQLHAGGRRSQASKRGMPKF